MKLATCPYCGNKVPYFKLFVIKSKCDYVCGKCKRESKISTSQKLNKTFYLAVLISALIILINIIFKSTDNLWLVAMSFLPMVIFYLLVPFYIKLKPYIKYRDVVCERLKTLEKEEKAARAARRAKSQRASRPDAAAKTTKTQTVKNTASSASARSQRQTKPVQRANRKGSR